ncbi:MAG TPA: YbdK family carboxylate-amine ligase [Solirubrobacteraceae bacterium]|jgi:carboxylate-amine ligase|nr:YbdK family carboxylate-amine ligase [Solirubrobacteraceae bacterium]
MPASERVTIMRHPTSDPLAGPDPVDEQLPDWARWAPSAPYSLGAEEEVMVLEPGSWRLARDSEVLLANLPMDLSSHISAETHDAVLEIATRPHREVAGVGAELRRLRRRLQQQVDRAGLRMAACGTHPAVTWEDVRVSPGSRYQLILESMRGLARREPTFALHVHVGVPDGAAGVALLNRMRTHLPLLLALSANSPFWQGRDSGLSSVRTPIFQGFPRVGIPLAFASYLEYVDVVDQLLRCGAFPEPSFLWWDVRLRPVFGTVEVRVMDVQSTVERSVALTALIQSIARLELEEGFHDGALIHAPEILNENRFLAARDGMDARFLDPVSETSVEARDLLAELLSAAMPHAQDLGAEDALSLIPDMARNVGAEQQRRIAETMGIERVISMLSDRFSPL